MKTTPSEITPEQYHVLKSKRPRKYRNKKTERDGVTFDSIKESNRYIILKTLESEGKIWGLEYHKRFDIEVNRQLICRYEADFTYHNAENPINFVVEDVKSEITRKLPVYRLKAKLMLAVWGITIIEI